VLYLPDVAELVGDEVVVASVDARRDT